MPRILDRNADVIFPDKLQCLTDIASDFGFDVICGEAPERASPGNGVGSVERVQSTMGVTAPFPVEELY